MQDDKFINSSSDKVWNNDGAGNKKKESSNEDSIDNLLSNKVSDMNGASKNAEEFSNIEESSNTEESSNDVQGTKDKETKHPSASSKLNTNGNDDEDSTATTNKKQKNWY